MKQHPSTSVIIPSYNAGRWVTEAIDSVLVQTLAPAQVMVIDDGSTDDTRQRLAPYLSRGVEYVHQENGGVSKARNNGVARANGEFIAFLDADDVWHPRKLEIQHALMLCKPRLAMLGTECLDWPACFPETLPNELPPLRIVAWEDLAVKNDFATSSVLVRRKILDDFEPGPFDRELQGPEDYDLWLRIALKHEVAIVQLPLTGYRQHWNGLGNQIRTMRPGMARILSKLDQQGAWKTRPLLRQKAHAYFHFSCSLMYGAAGEHRIALREAILSCMRYPLPFNLVESRERFARARRLGAALLRAVRG